MTSTRSAAQRHEARLAWQLVAPALVVLIVVAAGPLLVTAWQSLHLHDLRMPWLGKPFTGPANYLAAFSDARLYDALLHTVGFTLASVGLELLFGLALALGVDSLRRGRGLATLILVLPWALPTVVVALLWQFMFDSQSGIVPAGPGGIGREWLSHPTGAWIPIVLGDVWKSTPFVALLLLAGLQGIDQTLYEAARLDGARAWRRFTDITLPLLRPALLVALVFRTLDAFRVFDLVYVLTGGGPGTATEVVSLYAFTTILQDLRFGYGSALSMIVFAITFALALLYIRLLAPPAEEAQ
ncbi:MAG: sugar ABC transporter permease [Acidobacteria bacterium]|nr:sugar ABC transporter permease [Acidobacteriota bacterium]